ncbi:MAG: hypothetical protein ACRD1R_01350 [Acidobacteriota bacterium]
MEEPLLDFLDSLPGKTRSEKLERALITVKRFEEEKELRRLLSEYQEDEEEKREREIWECSFAEAMWNE